MLKTRVAGLNDFCSLKECKCSLGGVDFVTLIFTVRGPLHRMQTAIAACFSVLKPGGLLLFRDYGLYGMTMLRFEPDKKVGFRKYMWSDGTRSYFFGLDTVRDLFVGTGFTEVSGKIPISTQLESFDPSIYLGNPKLCGLPLPNKCPREEIIVEPPILVRGKDKRIQEDDDKFITTGFYVSMGLGFILGFWTAFGTMIFNIPSRHPYFEFLDRIQNWFYVTIALSMARLQRMLQR